jgi:hypothetical protein
MANSIPTQSPGFPGIGGGAQADVSNVPTQGPPSGVVAASGSGCGCSASGSSASAGASAALPAAVADTSMAPSLKPGSASVAAATAAWHSNVHVTGLWGINQDRNSWAYLDDSGWKKLSTSSPSGIVALTVLAAHAYERHSVASLYEGSDGQISQLYVW